MFTVVRTIHRCSYLVGCRTYRAELGLLHSAMVDKNAVRLPRLYGHTAAAQQEIDEIISDRKHLIVKFSNEKSASFNSLWLRHHCQCTECVQPHSGQKLVNPLTFPINLTLKDSAVKDGLVTLKWNEDDHVAQIPLEYLLENQYSPEARKTQDDIRDVSYLMGPDVPTVECDEVMNSQEGLLSWLVALNEFGAAVVKKCPKKKGFLDKIVPRITNIMPTIYGHNFVVEDTDRPVNVAYSNIRLDLHMDLIYYESAPGLQFLHCIKFNEDVQGGESELLDSFLVADEMRKNFPQHFRALCEIPATFQKIHYERDNPVSMRYRKPHFEANEFDKTPGHTALQPAHSKPTGQSCEAHSL
ncbi:2-(trimethylamino)ethylphosphonate dioxygenase-like isoform X2 [Tubulanus polymorphus]|uniref:2-(trimethylamino)ethylphosphonate dioxygenase-like isoform X2 n=1 Tax=Tubulanus polymorphus TaxID=672921 RepID=UPI003DA4ABC9